MAKTPKVIVAKPGDHLQKSSKFVLFDPKTNKFFGIGNGWRDDIAYADTANSQKELINRLRHYNSLNNAVRLLSMFKIIRVDTVHTFESEQPCPKKDLDQLKFLQRVEKAIETSKMTDAASIFYRDYAARGGPSKSKYHYVFQFNPSKVHNWYNKLSQEKQLEVAPSRWYSPDFGYMSEFLGRLTRPIGLKYPEVKYGNNFLATKTKAQAVHFRLTQSIPFEFFDFEDIYNTFEKTGKMIK